MIEKREHVRPAILVRPDGVLAGHEFLMHRITAPDWIALRRGDLDEDRMIEIVGESIVDSSLPEGTVLDLVETQVLSRAWIQATWEDAVPPAPGTD